MALSPMTLELIRLESLPKTSFFTKSYAIHRKGKAVKLLQDQLNFYEKNSPGEVINVFGKNLTGKSRMADSIAAEIIKKNNYTIQFQYDVEEAYSEIEKKEVTVIEPGKKLRSFTSLEYDYEYIMNQLQTVSSNKKVITILITETKIPGANWYIETIAINTEKKTNFAIIHLGDFAFGSIQPTTKENPIFQEYRKEAKEAYLRSENEYILQEIEQTTQDVINRWLKRKEIIFAEDPKKIDPEDPPIIFRNVIILGGQGDGKSTLSKILVKLKENNYGPKHVHAIRHERDITGMINNGFSSDKKKYIQVFVANDFTFTNSKIEDLQEFTKIRHKMVDQAGIVQGLACCILNQHYLTGKGSHVAYRNIVDFMFVLNPSDHKFTRKNVLSELMTEAHLNFLDYILELREKADLSGNAEEFLRLKGYGICIIKGKSYPFYFNRNDFEISHIEKYESGLSVLTDIKPRIKLTPVDNKFLEIFRIRLTSFLEGFTKNDNHIRWYIDYYVCDEHHTHQSIAEKYNINPQDEKGRDAIRIAIKRLKEKVTKEDAELTKLGHVLEETLEEYLNLDSPQQIYTAGTGGPNQPDLLNQTKDLAINCKFRHRPESTYYNQESTPENKYKKCWLAIYDRKYKLRFHENKEREAYITLHSEEGVSVGDFMKKISDGDKENVSKN